MSSNLPGRVLLDRYYPGVLAKRTTGEFETLLGNEKHKCRLGGRQQHYWRDEMKRLNP